MSVSITWSNPGAGMSFPKAYAKRISPYGPFYESCFQQFKIEHRRALIAKFHESGWPISEWSDFVEAEFEAHIRAMNPHIFQSAPVRNPTC